MGYDAYSHVVYGVTVNRSELETVDVIRTCRHKTDETKKFCSECGKPVWKQESVSILDNLDSNEDSNNLGYFYESYDHKQSADYEFMIGFQLGKTGYNRNRSTVKQPTEQMKQELLDFIKENNLKLTEKDIRMIVYTYHSY